MCLLRRDSSVVELCLISCCFTFERYICSCNRLCCRNKQSINLIFVFNFQEYFQKRCQNNCEVFTKVSKGMDCNLMLTKGNLLPKREMQGQNFLNRGDQDFAHIRG